MDHRLDGRNPFCVPTKFFLQQYIETSCIIHLTELSCSLFNISYLIYIINITPVKILSGFQIEKKMSIRSNNKMLDINHQLFKYTVGIKLRCFRYLSND